MRGHTVQETIYSKIKKQVDHEFFILFLRSIRPLVAKETGEEIRDILESVREGFYGMACYPGL